MSWEKVFYSMMMGAGEVVVKRGASELGEWVGGQVDEMFETDFAKGTMREVGEQVGNQAPQVVELLLDELKSTLFKP